MDHVYSLKDPSTHPSKLVIVTTAVALQAGATIVLGRKFSASRFWDDCTKYDVTAFTVCSLFMMHLSISLLTKGSFSTLVNSAVICLVNPHIHKKETTKCVLCMAMACVLMCGTDSETGNRMIIMMH